MTRFEVPGPCIPRSVYGLYSAHRADLSSQAVKAELNLLTLRVLTESVETKTNSWPH